MTKSSKAALAALLAGTLGMSAMTTASFAQETGAQTPGTQQQQQVKPDHKHNGVFQRFKGGFGPGGNQFGPGGGWRDGLLDVVCSDRGAEMLDIAFVRASYRLDLTEAQKPLFEALKTAAMSAQADFADTCAAARTTDQAQADLLGTIKSRLAIDTARIEAINSTLPALTAFYDSLTDAQKAALAPHRHGGKGFGQFGPGHDAPQPPPGAPAPDNAPADAPPPPADGQD